MEIGWLSAVELAAAVRAGDLAPSEIAVAMVERIETFNPALNAYVHFDPAQVLEAAARLDRAEHRGPLHGVPFAIKALSEVEGLPSTLGLLPFKAEVSHRDQVLVRRMKDAGGLFLGLTNSPEMGYYGGTDGHLWGPTHNPWKHGYTAGGSSGGSAAAVAAGLAPLAEGSDGAGSVRIPAALCGIFALKPSRSLLPTHFGYQTHVFHGPMTRTVADAALMLDVLAGPDGEDPLSGPHPGTGFGAALAGDLTGWRIAWSPDLGLGYVDPTVAAICAMAVEAFAELGATVVEATPAWGPLEDAMWTGLWVPGYAKLHDVLDPVAVRGQVDDNLLEIVAQAARITAVDLGRADTVRMNAWRAYSAFMAGFDLLVSPTLASAAFPLSQFAPGWLADAPLSRRILGWLLTYPFNMLGVPAASVPAGHTADGLPVGLQLAGKHLGDAAVLRAAARYEDARPWPVASAKRSSR